MYISDKTLAARFGVTRPTIWRWTRENPQFPKPVSLSPGCTRWSAAEIEAWEKGAARLDKSGTATATGSAA